MIRVAQAAGLHLAPVDPPQGSSRADGKGKLKPDVLAQPVLIIEDEGVIAWTLESMLEDIGFTSIAIAATADDALRHAQQGAPGLIISDINLGADATDGVSATATIAAGTKTAVVFVTGYANADARQRILRDMPRALVLRKPVNAADLRDAIIAATGDSEQH